MPCFELYKWCVLFVLKPKAKESLEKSNLNFSRKKVKYLINSFK